MTLTRTAPAAKLQRLKKNHPSHCHNGNCNIVYGCLYVSMNIRMCESCTVFIHIFEGRSYRYAVFPNNLLFMKNEAQVVITNNRKKIRTYSTMNENLMKYLQYAPEPLPHA